MLTHIRTYPNDRDRPDDFTIRENGVNIGRIYKTNAVAREQWIWAIQVNDPKKTRNGIAGTFDEAKEAFRKAWAAV